MTHVELTGTSPDSVSFLHNLDELPSIEVLSCNYMVINSQAPKVRSNYASQNPLFSDAKNHDRSTGHMSGYSHIFLWTILSMMISSNFSRYWPFVREIHLPPANSPHKGQWRRALMFLWSSPWIHNDKNKFSIIPTNLLMIFAPFHGFLLRTEHNSYIIAKV